MLPLIRMTWIINRRLLVGFSPILAFYLSVMVYGQSGGKGPPFAFVFPVITCLVTAIITFQGLTLNVEGFLLSLPVTRAQIVRAKYLTCLLGLMAGVALPLVISWLAHALAPGKMAAPSPEVLRTEGKLAILLALGIFLMLPFVHHFGPSKGLLFFSITAILLPAAGLAWKGLDGAETLGNIFNRAVAHPPLALGLGAGLLVFGLASLGLSTWSYLGMAAREGRPSRLAAWGAHLMRSVRRRPILAGGATLLLGATLVLGVSLAGARKREAATVARMEQLIQSYVSTRQLGSQFMGSVLVARDGDVILSQGYGTANLEGGIPNSPTTRFPIASLTKQFTAAAILLLEERGQLGVQDPVKKFLPDAPRAWDEVTIYHLLSHTSGIPDYLGFPDFEPTAAIETTPERLVARFRDKALEFRPGAQFKYSNSGYVLLGYLLEKITGQTYATFLQQNFFDPLGMKNSGTAWNATILPPLASGYEPKPLGPKPAETLHMSIPYAAGGLYSTTGDLLLWERGIFGGRLLKPASLHKMTTPFKGDYAFGLGVISRYGRKVFQHGGALPGFSTLLAYYPADKVTVVVLGNLRGGAPGLLAGQLAALAHDEKILLDQERTEITVAKKVLGEYVGTYDLSPEVHLSVSLEGDHLRVQPKTEQVTGPRIQMFAESEKMFFLKSDAAEIEFVRNGKGEVTHAVFHQGGNEQKATRR